MSAKDTFHKIVRIALEKDGWCITSDQFTFSIGGVKMSIDLMAEKMIIAEKTGQKIAVEIKSFLEQSSQ